jgi:hypothetical protein
MRKISSKRDFKKLGLCVLYKLNSTRVDVIVSELIISIFICTVFLMRPSNLRDLSNILSFMFL